MWLNTNGRSILDDDEKVAFEAWFRSGRRGYLGVHSASASEYVKYVYGQSILPVVLGRVAADSADL